MSFPSPITEAVSANNTSTWRSRLAFFAIPFTAGIGSAALAGFAARWGWVFELASHFRTQYFWGLLVGTVALAIARRRNSAFVAGLLVVVHAGQLWPFYVPGSDLPHDKPNLRVLSLNVHAANRHYDDVLRLIRDESPDVAVFLEVSDPWADALSALQTDWPYSRARSQEGNFGVALYSRLPFADARIEFLSNGCPAVVARIDVGGTPVTIYGAHPHPPMTGGFAASRNRQLAALAELVLASSGEKIVVGDLNTTSWSPVFADLLESTGLRDSRAGLGVQATWQSGWPLLFRIPIDHCLVSPGIQVVARSIGSNVGSDHLPVIVDLAVDQNQSP